MVQNILILVLIHFLVYFHNNVKGRTVHKRTVNASPPSAHQTVGLEGYEERQSGVR